MFLYIFPSVVICDGFSIEIMCNLCLQATIKSLKVGPFKDNHKSSTNRYTQIRYQPKCQFREQQKWHRFVPKICKNLGFLKHTSKANSFLLISSQSRLPIDPPSKQKTPSHNL
jgi:Tfp pilus assembly protein FimT